MASTTQDDPVMRLPPEERLQAWADEAWPLRFTWHNFGARCHNTDRCSVLYDNHEHISDWALGSGDAATTENELKSLSSRAPQRGIDDWSASYMFLPSDHSGRDFPDPIEIAWTSMDGASLHASVDLNEIFKDRLVLHGLDKGDIPVAWLGACAKEPVPVDILVEVNDRTVNVYMQALLVLKGPNEPSSEGRMLRKERKLAWSQTF